MLCFILSLHAKKNISHNICWCKKKDKSLYISHNIYWCRKNHKSLYNYFLKHNTQCLSFRTIHSKERVTVLYFMKDEHLLGCLFQIVCCISKEIWFGTHNSYCCSRKRQLKILLSNQSTNVTCWMVDRKLDTLIGWFQDWSTDVTTLCLVCSRTSLSKNFPFCQNCLSACNAEYSDRLGKFCAFLEPPLLAPEMFAVRVICGTKQK